MDGDAFLAPCLSAPARMIGSAGKRASPFRCTGPAGERCSTLCFELGALTLSRRPGSLTETGANGGSRRLQCIKRGLGGKIHPPSPLKVVAVLSALSATPVFVREFRPDACVSIRSPCQSSRSRTGTVRAAGAGHRQWLARVIWPLASGVAIWYYKEHPIVYL